ncbi:MAG: gamma-glutamyl-gamma-aminobutyrate hydrolase family protein [Alphaproteobacteria bacterium]|nr:gamma-glutamyl-gamma-aminobutyrate hydrolase family protein [Alphaproteobacteria bacterium]
MRLIALSQRVVTDSVTQERRDALDQRWWNFLAAAGFLPLALPNRVDQALRLIELVKPSGIVLTGGGDLTSMGGDTPERDEVEQALIELALSGSLPLLGVCRGMQAILHHFKIELAPIEGHVRQNHLLSGPAGNARTVNSYHNFSAVDVLPPLVASARAMDNSVEAIRHHDLPGLRGIMWHPEREVVPSPHDITLFRDLFGGVS